MNTSSTSNSAAAPATSVNRKPFDTVLRDLLAISPLTFVRLLGLPAGNVEFVNADLSGTVIEADAVLKVTLATGSFYLLHIEFQASHDPKLRWRLLDYNTRVTVFYKTDVVTLLILLRPEADGPELNGELTTHDPQTGTLVHNFQYRMLRVWELSPTDLLAGDLFLVPFAPVTNDAVQGDPESVVDAMRQRILDEASTPAVASELSHFAATLLGLRYTGGVYQHLRERILQGMNMNWMRESLYIQELIAEGELLGRQQGELLGELAARRESVLRHGRKRLGEPTGETLTSINQIVDSERLRSLDDRLFEDGAETWDDLLVS